MSFSADWLALRAPADDRARDAALAKRAASLVPASGRIVDVGSGTGATVRALHGLLPEGVRWTLVDADAALLAEASRLCAADGIAVETVVADLASNPLPFVGGADLVTASALFDLTSPAFMDAFAKALAAARLPLYAALTFNGDLMLSPTHPRDSAMVGAFNTHQRGDKGFGPAAGPLSAQHLACALAAEGHTVHLAPSPWTLAAPHDRALMDALLEGWADAAVEIGEDAASVRGWTRAHHEADAIVVGHLDILALPA